MVFHRRFNCVFHILFEVRGFLYFYVNCSFTPVVHLKFFGIFFLIFLFFQMVIELANTIYKMWILMLKSTNEHLRQTRISFKIPINFKVKHKNLKMKRLFLQLHSAECQEIKVSIIKQGTAIMNLITWYTEDTIPFLSPLVKNVQPQLNHEKTPHKLMHIQQAADQYFSSVSRL